MKKATTTDDLIDELFPIPAKRRRSRGPVVVGIAALATAGVVAGVAACGSIGTQAASVPAVSTATSTPTVSSARPAPTTTTTTATAETPAPSSSTAEIVGALRVHVAEATRATRTTEAAAPTKTKEEASTSTSAAVTVTKTRAKTSSKKPSKKAAKKMVKTAAPKRTKSTAPKKTKSTAPKKTKSTAPKKTKSTAPKKAKTRTTKSKPQQTTTAPATKTTEHSAAPTPAKPAAPTVHLGPTVTIYGNYSGGNANIRSGPGTDHHVVGGLAYRHSVQARLYGNTGWYRISGGHYIAASVVSTTRPAPVETTAPEPEPEHRTPAPTETTSPEPEHQPAPVSTGSVQSILASYLPGPATLIVQHSVGCGLGTPAPGTAVGCTGGGVIRIALGAGIPPASETVRSLVLHEYGHVLETRWIDGSAQRQEATQEVGWEPLADCIAFRLGAHAASPGGYTTAAGCTGERGDLAAAIVAGRDYKTAAQQAIGPHIATAASVYDAPDGSKVGVVETGTPIKILSSKTATGLSGTVTWLQIGADRWVDSRAVAQ